MTLPKEIRDSIYDSVIFGTVGSSKLPRDWRSPTAYFTVGQRKVCSSSQSSVRIEGVIMEELMALSGPSSGSGAASPSEDV